MKTLLTLLGIGCAATSASLGASIFHISFDTPESIEAWNVAGDPFGETSKSWLPAGGNPGGALEFGGYHNGEGAGRGYELFFTTTDLSLGGATDFSFDAILTGPIDGTNIQLRVLFDGVPLFGTPGGFISLNAPGPLNGDSWTNFSYDLSSIDPAATNMTITFLVAAGAFAGAGATMAIDNVSVIPEPSAYAALFGLIGLACVAARRRRRQS
ncbi:MAG: PEP-CTERM sorting domain-containing protein [Opitutales bacterium]|nr:PEP-CTERM sorting domain-containing protein [Opitutales bacterium]